MNPVDAINAILPQTQCELCTYKGCRLYSEAIVEKDERIDLCEPGGVKTLRAIANITNQDPEPFLLDLQKKTKPMILVLIREEACIGCTKCIQACPVDAIIGSAKKMHTVLSDICNGCELCITPCPVDCMDRVPHPKYSSALEISEISRKRFEKRNQRLATRNPEKQTPKKGSIAERKAAIQASIERVKSG